MDKEFTKTQEYEYRITKTKGYEYRMKCYDDGTELTIIPIDILVLDDNYYKIKNYKVGNQHAQTLVRIKPEGALYFEDSVWLSEENTSRAVNLIISAVKSEYERQKDECFEQLDKELKNIKSMEKFIKENTNGN